MRNKSFSRRFFSLILPLTLMLIFILFPFYWTFVTSVKPQAELLGPATYWPKQFTWDSYIKLFKGTVDFGAAMRHSFFVAAVTTIVSLTVSTLASYAFSRYRFPGRKFLMGLFLSNNMFPTVLLLIPLYSLMRKLGFLYKPISLILAYTTFTIPFSVCDARRRRSERMAEHSDQSSQSQRQRERCDLPRQRNGSPESNADHHPHHLRTVA